MAQLKFSRVLALPGTPAANTIYLVKSATAGDMELYVSNNDGTDVRHLPSKTEIQAMIGNASISGADKLTTARTISATGDVAWSVTFDGSANVTNTATLSDTGVGAGSYAKVTVDAKGRVTAGSVLAAGDIPSLPGSKINSDLSVNTTGNAATATKLAAPVTINGVSFDGSAAITISATDSTARIASSEKGVANGVATLDADGKVPSSQLPSYVDDVVEAANFAALPATGETSKIYVTLDDGKIFRWSGSAYIEISASAGTSDTAAKLATARSIAATGDITWSVNFDGSANVTAAAALADSGVTAGSYAKVTVDAKGRVTAGSTLAVSDIPSLDSTKVTSAAAVELVSADW